MRLILAIDQDRSATKAVLLDARGSALDKPAFSHRRICLRPGWVEQDAEGIWSLKDRSALAHNPTEFKPQMSQSKVRQLHAQWLAAVETVL
jgi:glycerol kinase